MHFLTNATIIQEVTCKLNDLGTLPFIFSQRKTSESSLSPEDYFAVIESLFFK